MPASTGATCGYTGLLGRSCYHSRHARRAEDVAHGRPCSVRDHLVTEGCAMTADTESADAIGGLGLDHADPDSEGPKVLSVESWKELRDVRLAALDESPHAFVSDRDSEAAFKEADWRRRIESATWVAVRRGGNVVGVACAVTAPEEPFARYVESVWVDCRHRREGILTAMLEKLRKDAWLRGATQLRLWVLDTNRSAQAAYEKLSFTVDADQEPVDTKKRRADDTYVKEQRMYRDISSPFL